jgi:hypothetical protein
MNIGEKDITDGTDDSDVVLNMKHHLEVVTPIAACVTVIRQNRIVKENAEAVEIGPQAIEHNDVRRDQ